MKSKKAKSSPAKQNLSNKQYGFIHIGKTAGSSINQLARLSIKHGYQPPTMFGHGARLPAILRKYSQIKVGFFLRDPIERTISGFQSRLRQGRPTYSSMWSTEEACAFSFFNNASDFLSALVSRDDERLRSAALFAERHITHVVRNYAFHLKGLDFLEKNRDRIYFCHPLGDLSSTLHQLFEPCGIPKDFIEQHYDSAHSAGGGTEKILASLGEEKLTALKKHFAREYRIYNYLLGLD